MNLLGFVLLSLVPSSSLAVGGMVNASFEGALIARHTRATGPEFLQPVQATLSTGWQVDQCIDGNPTSGLCHSYPSVAPWLAIDYGSSVEIERVEIFNRRDCCGDRTKNVEVRISNDLPTTDSQMFSGGALLGHFSGPGTDGEHIIITGGPLSGRYVIVQMSDNHDDHIINLNEVRAFGLVQPIEVSEGVLKIPPTVNENLVELSTADWTSGAVQLLHPVAAIQSSTYLGVGEVEFTERDFPAAKCIDGDTEGHSLVDRNMCHTQNEPSPWLAIDYGKTVTVNRVEIFNREACCGDRTKNVDVRVSDELPTSANAMFSGGSLLGHFAGPGTNGQHIIITGEAMSGRYVIIQMDNGEDLPLNLMEVMAFGPEGEARVTICEAGSSEPVLSVDDLEEVLDAKCAFIAYEDDARASCNDLRSHCNLNRRRSTATTACWSLNWCRRKIRGRKCNLFKWPECCYHPSVRNNVAGTDDWENCIHTYAPPRKPSSYCPGGDEDEDDDLCKCPNPNR